MKYSIIFPLFSILLNSCIKEECQINGGYYEFEIPATLTPAKDTFQIGDTITIISSFSDEVYERKTDKYYKLENFRFYPELRIREISVSPANEAAVSNFEVLIDTATNFHRIDYSTGEVGYIGEYSYSNSRYELEYKLIPKASGFYHFSHLSVVFGLGENQSFEGKCSNLKDDAAVKLNDGADNNIELLHDSPDPHYNDWILQKPEDRFHKFGGYCFYVRG